MKFKTVKISDLISEISMGPFGSNIKVECFVDAGIPVLNGSNLDGFALKEDSFRYVTEEKADSLGKANAHKGDVVITHRGTLGQIVFIPKDSLFDRYVISQSQFRVRCNEKILPEYLVYYFHTRIGQHKLLSNASQVGVPALARASTTFQSIEISVPDIESQQKILGLLETIRYKIEANNAINKNLEEQAQALFKKMIVASDSSSCFLSEIAKINPKRTLSKGTIARCIDMAQLSTSGSFPAGWEYKSFNGGMRFCNGDTLLARITPCLENGKTAYINFLDDDEIAFGSTEYVVMCSNGDYSNEFFYCLARYPAFVDYAVKNMNGTSGRQRVSAETIGMYQLPRLTKSEMQDFNTVVPQMFDVCCQNFLENIKLANLRDALLPRLMSGEIDVSGIEV